MPGKAGKKQDRKNIEVKGNTMTILDDLSSADMATPQQRTVLCKRAHDEIVRLRLALQKCANRADQQGEVVKVAVGALIEADE